MEYTQDFGDHIYWPISKTGRSKKLQDRHPQTLSLIGTAGSCVNLTETSDQLAYTITKVGSKLENGLQTQDSFGRMIKHIGEDVGSNSEAFPTLDLAVLYGNAIILSHFLEDHQRRVEGLKVQKRHFSQKKIFSGSLLANALGLAFFAVVRLLHRSVIDIKHTDHYGHAALHLAVRSWRIEYLTKILQGCDGNRKLDIDARKSIFNCIF